MQTHPGERDLAGRRTPLVAISPNKQAAPIVVTRCGKVYVTGRRIHHGLIGEILIAIGLALHSRLVTGAGAALVLHDRPTFRSR